MARSRTKPNSSAPDWASAFHAAFAATGNMTRACEAAKVGRTSVFDRLRVDEAFAAAHGEARAKAADLLEEEARRRAVNGTERHVVHRGEVVFVWVNPAGAVVADEKAGGVKKVPLIERRFSDRLLSQLLQACRRKFRLREHKHRHRIDTQLTIIEQIEQITDGTENQAPPPPGQVPPEQGAVPRVRRRPRRG